MYERRPGFFRDDAPLGRRVDAKVKWFSASKGFGFVTPTDGSPDAFLPMAVLRRAGYEELRDGASISCEVGAGAKGPLVTSVLSVDNGTATAQSGRAGGFERRIGGNSTTLEGVVKRFDPAKATGSSRPMAAARMCSSTSPRCAAAGWPPSIPDSGSWSRWSTARTAKRPNASP